MYKLTNKVDRSIGLPSPYGSVVLEVGESANVSDTHYAALLKKAVNRSQLIPSVVEVERFEAEPDAVEPEVGVKLVSTGRGKWMVEVNGQPVHDQPLTKAKATKVAADYA